MLPFCECQAHPDDPLPAHLERVAARAAASIAPGARAGIRATAALAGLFHDIGKATPWFQAYLRGQGRRSPLSHHAELGALIAWWYASALGWPLWQRLALFIAVRRHHGHLRFQDWSVLLLHSRAEWQDADSPLHRQLAAMDLAGINAWLIALAAVPAPLLPQPPTGPLTPDSIGDALRDKLVRGRELRKAFNTLDDALGALASFGALLATDRVDAALSGAHLARAQLPVDLVSRHRAAVGVGGNAAGAPGGDDLNARRERIAATVANTWAASAAANPDQHLFTLTAPTGAGKTLTILHAALQARARLEQTQGQPPRIIYCLPFTSVIDQNHAIFRTLLDQAGLGHREDLLLKHHHLTDPLFRTEEDEYQADGAGPLLTETWQSECVVTTFHQLLHSLLSAHNGHLKRAGQLTGALVLLDEVQALPLRYWEAIRQLLRAAAATLDTRFVLLTATRPLILSRDDACELLPDHPEHFRALARTKLICHQRAHLTLTDFAEHLATALAEDARPTLIVLNRRRAVRELFASLTQALPQRALIGLSTSLTPKDRRARIRLIRRLLRQGRAPVVVATQLIEAGVDLSFPVVHRDLAPLDGVIQAAGRCNRHGECGQGRGEVHLWALRAEREDGTPGEFLWQRVYDSALIEVTVGALGERERVAESDFLALAEVYFHGCRARQDQSRIDEHLRLGDFESLREDFRLIDDPPALTLFVRRHPSDERLWQRYQALQHDPDLSPLDQRRAFRAFRPAFYERIIQVPFVNGRQLERAEIHPVTAADGVYERTVGYIDLPAPESTCLF